MSDSRYCDATFTDQFGNDWGCTAIVNDGHPQRFHTAAWSVTAGGSHAPAITWPIEREWSSSVPEGEHNA